MNNAMVIVTPLPPYIDGYDRGDIITAFLNEENARFSPSKKTLYVPGDDITLDVFRKCGSEWICWGAKSKQKWTVIVLDPVLQSFTYA